jgi:hypothetical protein
VQQPPSKTRHGSPGSTAAQVAPRLRNLSPRPVSVFEPPHLMGTSLSSRGFGIAWHEHALDASDEHMVTPTLANFGLLRVLRLWTQHAN